MGDINSQFKMKTSEWQGYVRRALEDICERQKVLEKKIEHLDTRLTNVQIKVASIGGVAGFLVSIITILLKELIFRR